MENDSGVAETSGDYVLLGVDGNGEGESFPGEGCLASALFFPQRPQAEVPKLTKFSLARKDRTP